MVLCGWGFLDNALVLVVLAEQCLVRAVNVQQGAVPSSAC
jgi:hypothetical protein